MFKKKASKKGAVRKRSAVEEDAADAAASAAAPLASELAELRDQRAVRQRRAAPSTSSTAAAAAAAAPDAAAGEDDAAAAGAAPGDDLVSTTSFASGGSQDLVDSTTSAALAEARMEKYIAGRMPGGGADGAADAEHAAEMTKLAEASRGRTGGVEEFGIAQDGGLLEVQLPGAVARQNAMATVAAVAALQARGGPGGVRSGAPAGAKPRFASAPAQRKPDGPTDRLAFGRHVRHEQRR